MTRPTFYHNGDGEYTALTGESPRGFPNLFAAFTGPSPAALQETCFPLNVLGDPVEADELPKAWAAAFKRVGIDMSEPTRGIREEELLTHVALGLDPLTALVASVDDDDYEPAEYPEWAPVAIVVVGIIISWLVNVALF